MPLVHLVNLGGADGGGEAVDGGKSFLGEQVFADGRLETVRGHAIGGEDGLVEIHAEFPVLLELRHLADCGLDLGRRHHEPHGLCALAQENRLGQLIDDLLFDPESLQEFVGNGIAELPAVVGDGLFVAALKLLEGNLLFIDGDGGAAIALVQHVGSDTPEDKDQGDDQNHGLDNGGLRLIAENLQHGRLCGNG